MTPSDPTTAVPTSVETSPPDGTPSANEPSPSGALSSTDEASHPLVAHKPPKHALLSLRAFYFFHFGALGTIFPFLPLVFRRRMLSPRRIGQLLVVNPLAGLVVPLIWGALADLFQMRTQLLRYASFGSALGVLAFLPAVSFWQHLLAMGLYAFFRTPVITLADATTCSVTGADQSGYSHTRVWGSVGFALCVYTAGALDASIHATPMLLAGVALYLGSAMVTWPLPSPRYPHHKGMLQQTHQLLANPTMLLFLIANTFYYTGHASYDVYFSLHIHQLGHSDAFVGVAWAIAVAAEILVLTFMPRVTQEIRPGRLLTLCAALATARWFALWSAIHPVLILCVQPLHGFTFGLWYVSLVKFCQARPPEHLRTSLQAVTLSSVGLGMTFGYLGGGEIMDRWDGQTVFALAALCAASAAVIYTAVTAKGHNEITPSNGRC